VLAKVRDTIERQSGHMSRLLDDLLDMSRITRDVIELDRKPIDVARVLQEVIDNVRPQAVAKGQELSLTLQSGAAWVEADPTRLAQIIGNLLGNAVKYTPAGGRIHVSLAAREGSVRVAVADNGIGLAPEMVPKLFRLFAQLHPDLDVSAGGLGIGLAVSQRLAQMHGGELAATSAGLGQGAEFTLGLPQLQAPAQPAATEAPIVPAPRHLKVMVVDDNRDAAQILADVLVACGHEVQQAHDAAGAIETVLAMQPDAVVLDLGLPDASGVEVARRVRDDPALRDVLLVAVTGWGQEEDRRRTRDAGIDYHLVKPVEPTQLLNLLHASRSRRRGDPR
jgi:CheY-like chemotaxis protein/two-component sensor histidine kinase